MNSSDRIGQDGPDYSQHPELAIVSLMSMLSRFPFTRCARMAESILEHLHFVAREPRLPKAYRDTALHLIADWEWLVAGAPHASRAAGDINPRLH
jgi:hypothetical protein